MTLAELRKKINGIDRQIVNLLNRRARFALEIGRIKHKKGIPVYSPEREAEVYNFLRRINKGPIPSKCLNAIYREIMSGSIGIQKKLAVAYLGPEATFTHEAARHKFGSAVSYMGAGNIREIYGLVERGYADYGVVPIENSTEGAVTYTLDMFIDSPIKICAEVILNISHNLLGTGGRIREIKKIYSNPHVFGQCRKWISANMPNAELHEVSSTAAAAMRAAKGKGSAAIASRLAACIYRLKILRSDIEDIPGNATRFLVIGKECAGRTGRDKTSIMFAVKDKIGALHKTLNVFKRNRINLTKIESRPSRKKAWEYYFFADLRGHYRDEKIKKALAGLKQHCVFIKLLGSYPAGSLS